MLTVCAGTVWSSALEVSGEQAVSGRQARLTPATSLGTNIVTLLGGKRNSLRVRG
jgi:hypothetical protein